MNSVVKVNDTEEIRELPFINANGTNSSKQSSAETFVISHKMFPATQLRAPIMLSLYKGHSGM